MVDAQKFELDEPLQSVADEKLIKPVRPAGDAEQFGLVNSFAGRAVIKRIEHDAAGAAFRERKLIFVDETPFHRERDEHADERHDRHPEHHVPPRHDRVRHHHVGRQAGGERHRHVTGRGRDRLHRVVFQDGEILSQTDARQHAEHGKGEDDRGEIDAERDARFAGDIEIRRRENAAEKETGDGRSES